MGGFKGRSREDSSEAVETTQGREIGGVGLGGSCGGDDMWLDSGPMRTGELIGIAGGLCGM